MAICYRYISDKNDAEDVFQDAFVKVFDKLNQLKKIESIEWWMRRIFINEALRYNKQNKLNLYKIDNSEIENISDNIEEINESLENLSAEKISELIKELPVKARAVFNMYIIDKYSHAEIAEELGISVGTSKSQLHDARKMLQKKIAKYSLPKKIKMSV